MFRIGFINFILVFFCVLSSSAQIIEESELAVITRENWKAKEPVMQMIPHKPQFITIHHTGMPQKPQRSIEEKLQALQNFSQNDSPMADGSVKKAWPDVPYHFYIGTSGKIAEGRDINFQGDSNTDYDLNGHVLIVVEGDFNKEKLLPQQWESLNKLVSFLSSKYDISRETISGHKDQAETTCPGGDLYSKLALLKVKNPVKIGAERLFEAEYFNLIKDKKIGLVTNHTGLLPNGDHLVDLLYQNPETELTMLFGPEHGIRGEEDTHVSDSKDEKTGLPVVSLYGKTRKPTAEMLKDVEVLVFDIQDIGARFYTYIKTMLLVQEAAAENNVPFIVLDRPNAIGGRYVDGPVGKPGEPVTDIDMLPITHGMTVGELATMFNKERENSGLLSADLKVIPMENYKRELWYDQTGLPWIKPSPNMLNLTTATFYPATCLLEGTNVSEGRGTLKPFELIAAPWVHPEDLITQLESYNLKGISYKTTQITAQQMVDGIEIYPPKFMGEEIPAVELTLTNRDNFKSVEAGIYMLHALKKLYPEQLEWRKERLDGLLKTSLVREALDAGKKPREIIQTWQDDLEFFKKLRSQYLLY
ncbi:exo-beta-N-acetylmuramidase NamZ domain-containing protein [Salegentibacter sediminis]|uniref:exo-beta-N-acetylmuramidase NamZ domain-containing protein n=1 Tax=Salegentibacter sediminis TaxID=1930251 RepID=UPI0009BEA83C|nr:exo-beta-N-acetylmuramidase NamZ domain-containing protein [Salegentibacter sediminis]